MHELIEDKTTKIKNENGPRAKVKPLQLSSPQGNESLRYVSGRIYGRKIYNYAVHQFCVQTRTIKIIINQGMCKRDRLQITLSTTLYLYLLLGITHKQAQGMTMISH